MGSVQLEILWAWHCMSAGWVGYIDQSIDCETDWQLDKQMYSDRLIGRWVNKVSR